MKWHHSPINKKNEKDHNPYPIANPDCLHKHYKAGELSKSRLMDSGDINLLLKRSEDNGKTWSKEQVTWDDGSNSCGNPCPVVDEETGRICLFMTWNNSKLIFPGPSAYSCLTKLPNGNIGLFYEGGINKGYENMIFLSIPPQVLFSDHEFKILVKNN